MTDASWLQMLNLALMRTLLTGKKNYLLSRMTPRSIPVRFRHAVLPQLCRSLIHYMLYCSLSDYYDVFGDIGRPSLIMQGICALPIFHAWNYCHRFVCISRLYFQPQSRYP